MLLKPAPGGVRTPKANAQWGRDHWSTLFPALLAGAGVQGGTTYGRSDRTAAHPIDSPVSPEDLAATIYWALGINPRLMLPDAWPPHRHQRRRATIGSTVRLVHRPHRNAVQPQSLGSRSAPQVTRRPTPHPCTSESTGQKHAGRVCPL